MVWGKPAGAWANAVEEEEQEHGTIHAPAVQETEFPSLGGAVTVKETKKEKKKKQTMSLGEFVGSTAAPSRRAVDDDSILFNLPTAPRGRADGEEPSDGKPTLGGAFSRNYGPGGPGERRFQDEDRPRRRREDREDLAPSRADTVQDWGAERKFVPFSDSNDRFGGSGGGGGGSSFRDRSSGEDRRGFRQDSREPSDLGPSRADVVDDWGAARKFQPTSSSDRPRSSFRGRELSVADTTDRWERQSEHKPVGFDDKPRRPFDDGPGSGPRERRGFAESWRGRGLNASSASGDSREVSREEQSWRRDSSVASSASETDSGLKERPRLNLKPRSVPIGTTSSADASRPSIFGEARPREEVLKEQGKDVAVEDEKIEAPPRAPKISSRQGQGSKRAEEALLTAESEGLEATDDTDEQKDDGKEAKVEKLESDFRGNLRLNSRNGQSSRSRRWENGGRHKDRETDAARW